jgi:hypothetical protein
VSIRPRPAWHSDRKFQLQRQGYNDPGKTPQFGYPENEVNVTKTHTVRFTRHMEGTALEPAKVLEEDGYESGNVFGSLFGRALLSG